MTLTDAERAAMEAAAYRRLRSFIDEHVRASCKIMSLGDDCLCLLCDLDRLRAHYTSQARPPEPVAWLYVNKHLRDQQSLALHRWTTPEWSDVWIEVPLYAAPASAPPPAQTAALERMADNARELGLDDVYDAPAAGSGAAPDVDTDELVRELRKAKLYHSWGEGADVTERAADALTALRARVAELERGSAGLVQAAEDLDAGLTNIRADRDALAAQVERLTKDARRWDAIANLWAACTELQLTQDEDGRWSIRMIEAVENHRCETWTGEDPDAAVDAALAQSTPDAAGAGEG